METIEVKQTPIVARKTCEQNTVREVRLSFPRLSVRFVSPDHRRLILTSGEVFGELDVRVGNTEGEILGSFVIFSPGVVFHHRKILYISCK